jgi:hypothetical protein
VSVIEAIIVKARSKFVVVAVACPADACGVSEGSIEGPTLLTTQMLAMLGWVTG